MIDSTQLEPRRLFDKGELVHGTVVCAKQQTEGKGRYGRRWYTDVENLAMTLCVELPPDRNWAEICYVAALAVGDGIRVVAPKIHAQYKWVNDILIGDSKVGGVLLEILEQRFLLIGIGVNLASSPSLPDRPTTYLNEHDPAISSESLQQSILKGLIEHYNAWLRYGFRVVRTRWLANAYKLGQSITVKVPATSQEYSGVFVGIDMQGNLELETSGTVHKVSIGEVI